MYFETWNVCFWGVRSLRSLAHISCNFFSSVGTFGGLAPNTKKLATLLTVSHKGKTLRCDVDSFELIWFNMNNNAKTDGQDIRHISLYCDVMTQQLWIFSLMCSSQFWPGWIMRLIQSQWQSMTLLFWFLWCWIITMQRQMISLCDL